VKLEDFDFELPESQIARFPAERREGARLLVYQRETGETRHAAIPELVGCLQPGDLLVLNDVRVAPARLDLRRATGGAVEALALRWQGADLWMLADGRGRLKPGEVLEVDRDPALRVVLFDREREGWRACVEGASAEELLRRCGKVPLPPYIRKARERDGVEESAVEPLDRERYQTVFAAEGAAVAAPTAGLHLSEPVLAALAAREVKITKVRLHVGPGTFAPARTSNLDEHRMELERYEIPQEAAAAIRATRAAGGRVVAVGTTVVRTLEGVAARHGELRAGAGETDLFIRPEFPFRVVDALMTNFHLPQSTLLMLVSAFAGREATLALYREAVSRGYRFYSYGDAMLLL